VLGSYINGKLTYIGHTGSGFDETLLKELYNKLQAIVTGKSPFSEKIKTNMPVTWVEPKFVCELKFTEWTSDAKLRHPIFLRLRDDKKPADVKYEANKVNLPAMEDQSTPKKAAKTKKAVAAKETPIEKEVAAKQIAPPKKTASKKVDKTEVVKKAKAAKPVAQSKTEAKPATKTIENSGVVKNENEKIIKIGKAEIKITNRQKVFFPKMVLPKVMLLITTKAWLTLSFLILKTGRNHCSEHLMV
jgi:bifunctional non-homologous end joining protein LigD